MAQMTKEKEFSDQRRYAFKIQIYGKESDVEKYWNHDNFCVYRYLFGKCSNKSCQLKHETPIEDLIKNRKTITKAKLLIDYLEYMHAGSNVVFACTLKRFQAEYFAQVGLPLQAEHLYLQITEGSKYDPSAAIVRSYALFLINQQGNIEDGMRKLKKASQMKQSAINDLDYAYYLMEDKKYQQAYEVLKDVLKHNAGNWKHLHIAAKNLYYWANDEHTLELRFVLIFGLSRMAKTSRYRKDCEWWMRKVQDRWKYRCHAHIICEANKDNYISIILNEGLDYSFTPYSPHGRVNPAVNRHDTNNDDNKNDDRIRGDNNDDNKNDGINDDNKNDGISGDNNDDNTNDGIGGGNNDDNKNDELNLVEFNTKDLKLLTKSLLKHNGLTGIYLDIDKWMKNHELFVKVLHQNSWYGKYYHLFSKKGLYTIDDVKDHVWNKEDMIAILSNGNVSDETARSDGNKMFSKIRMRK